jgi:hypothetical protein
MTNNNYDIDKFNTMHVYNAMRSFAPDRKNNHNIGGLRIEVTAKFNDMHV